MASVIAGMFGASVSSVQQAFADIAHDINLSMATSMSAGFAPNL